MRVVLATLLENFDLERVGSADAVRERYTLTMLPEELRVRLKPRAVARSFAEAPAVELAVPQESKCPFAAFSRAVAKVAR